MSVSGSEEFEGLERLGGGFGKVETGSPKEEDMEDVRRQLCG